MKNDLQKAIDELRQTMGKMEMALGLIDEAIVWINAECVIEWCNGIFDQIAGKIHIEILGKHLPDILPLKELGTDQNLAPHPVERLLDGQTLIQTYYQTANKGPTVEIAGAPLKLPNQELGYILTLRDVSNQQELEQVRLQSLALHAAAEAIVITNAKGTVEWVNRSFTILTGYSAEEVTGRQMKILNSGHTPALTYKQMWEAISTGQVWTGELINKRKDGTIYNEEQSITPVRDRSDIITHYIAIKRDISQRKEAEHEIRKLSSVATRTDNSVIITNASGEIEWVNAAFTRMTEFSLNEVIGRRPGSFLQGPETAQKVIQHMSDCLKQHKGFDVEIINYSKSGCKFWISIEVRPLHDDAGNIVNFLGIENDITKRKRSEEREDAMRRREMDIAARIQRTLLLGKSRQRIRSMQMAAITRPSQLVDGDFFDCFIHSDDCMDIVIGDVMGKGVPAALLGAAAKSALLRSISSIISNSEDRELPSTEEIIMSLHASMVKELIDLESFITLVYARFCGKRNMLSFVDCGHTQSILCRKNGSAPELLTGINAPLGFVEREQYVQQEIPLMPGDVVVFYSDGITEAEDRNGTMYGEARLIDLVHQSRAENCEKIVKQIYQSIQQFSENEAEVFADDLTCIVVKVDEQKMIEILAEESSTYSAELDQLEQLGTDLHQFFSLNFPEKSTNLLPELHTGINEAAMNIIQHAFPSSTTDEPSLRMKLTLYKARIEIELFHNGRSFSGIPGSLPEPLGYKESGYGLYILEQSMDAVHYTRLQDGWNRVLMIKELPKPDL